MIFDSFIDVPLWNRASWQGVGFLCFPEQPPTLGLLFRDVSAGEEIFRQWKGRLGASDKNNELRITIVEGPIPGAKPGYNIRIGSNAPTILRLAKERGVAPPDSGILMISRVHRMNPPPGSENLHHFKAHYARHNVFDLVQISVDPARGMLVNAQSAIRKSEICLRQVEHILDGDIDRDAVVAPPG